MTQLSAGPFAPKLHVVTFTNCIKECCELLPWTKASERYVSFFNQKGGIGIFVLRFWLILYRFFGFCAKKTKAFWCCCSFQLADFTWFSIWFSVFVKNANGFSEFFPVCLPSEWQLSASSDHEQP